MSWLTYWCSKSPITKTHSYTEVETICLTSNVPKVEPINNLRSIQRHVVKLVAHDSSASETSLERMPQVKPAWI